MKAKEGKRTEKDKRTEILRRKLQYFSRFISGEKNISLEIDAENKACANIKKTKIYLPKDLDKGFNIKDEVDRDILYKGLDFHETAHIMLTGSIGYISRDWKEEDGSFQDFKNLVNAIEDYRIETTLKEGLPQTRRYLDRLNESIVEKHGGKIKTNNDIATALLSELHHLPYEIDDRLMPYVDEAMEILRRKDFLEMDFFDLVALCKRIHKILERAREKYPELTGSKHAQELKSLVKKGMGGMSAGDYEKEHLKAKEKARIEDGKKGEADADKMMQPASKCVCRDGKMADVKAKVFAEELKKRPFIPPTEEITDYEQEGKSKLSSDNVRIVTHTKDHSTHLRHKDGTYVGDEDFLGVPDMSKAVNDGRYIADILKNEIRLSMESDKDKTSGKLDIRKTRKTLIKGKGDLDRPDLFYRQFKNKHDHNVVVMVDLSGSMAREASGMSGKSRLSCAKQALITLSTMLESLEVPHAIYGYSAHGGTTPDGKDVVSHLVIKEFDEESLDKEYIKGCFHVEDDYLGSIVRFYHNRDGDSFRHVGEILKQKTGKNLLIVISDGRPEHYGYFKEIGIKDSTKAVREVEDSGVKVMGISITTEANDYITEAFDNNYFFDGDKINELADGLVDVYLDAIGDR